jgi:hypothetical protein
MSVRIRRTPRSNRRWQKMFDYMDAPQRGALMLVRFTAVGLIGLSVLELGLYGGECFVHHQPVQILHGMLLFIPFVLGVVIFARARAIAEWISNKFDE